MRTASTMPTVVIRLQLQQGGTLRRILVGQLLFSRYIHPRPMILRPTILTTISMPMLNV